MQHPRACQRAGVSISGLSVGRLGNQAGTPAGKCGGLVFHGVADRRHWVARLVLGAGRGAVYSIARADRRGSQDVSTAHTQPQAAGFRSRSVLFPDQELSWLIRLSLRLWNIDKSLQPEAVVLFCIQHVTTADRDLTVRNRRTAERNIPGAVMHSRYLRVAQIVR